MAASILTQDLLGILLLLAGGDSRMSLGEVLRAVDAYQERHDRHFGITRGDVRRLFIVSSFESTGREDVLATLERIQLREVLPAMLEAFEAYFTDRDEGWIHVDTQPDYDDLMVETWFGYDREQFRHELEVKIRMRSFLTDQNNDRPEQVLRFLKEVDVDERLLAHCSRPGESS